MQFDTPYSPSSFYSKILILGASALMLSACAGNPTTNPSQYMPNNLPIEKAAKVKVALGDVTLGYKPPNRYEAGMVIQALHNTLIKSNLFDQNSDNSLNIQIRSILIYSDIFGLTLTSIVNSIYILKTTYGKSIYEVNVHSTGKATPGDALMATERRNIAIRRAIAANQSGYVRKLAAYFDKNSKRVERISAAIPVKKAKIREETSPSKKTTLSGTAFAVNQNGYLITNAHVVSECKKVYAKGTYGNIPIVIIARDTKNDLALLKADLKKINFSKFRVGKYIRPADPVIVFGYPLHGLLSSDGTVTTGTVTALAGLEDDTRMLQITTPIQPGNSGGPLLDENGLIVGIVESKLNTLAVLKVTGDVPQNVNFAIKSTIAENFLDTNGINYSVSTSREHLSPADIGDIGKAISYRISCVQ